VTRKLWFIKKSEDKKSKSTQESQLQYRSNFRRSVAI